MNWPENLKLDPGARTALEKVPHQYPVLANWVEDQKFHDAEDVAAIAEILIHEFHDELKSATIAYLFKEKSTSRGRSPAAKATKMGARDVHLSSGYVFVIVVLWDRWKKMDLVTRVALVDHELEHFGIDDNGNFTMIEHDIQEFNTTVQRWGAWEPSVSLFLQAAKSQVEMFSSKEEATEPSSAPPPVQVTK